MRSLSKFMLPAMLLGALFLFSACDGDDKTVFVDVPGPGAIGPSSVTILVDRDLEATLTLADGETVDATRQSAWGSSNAAVATVAGGAITVVGVGETFISAAHDDDSTVSGTIRLVVEDVTGVTMTPAVPLAGYAVPKQFIATATTTSGQLVDVTALAAWTENGATATMSADGAGGGVLSTGTSAATVTVTATINDDAGNPFTDTQAVVVEDYAANSIVITSAGPTIIATEVGSKLQLTAIATLSDGTTTEDLTLLATWSSTDTPNAAVGANTGIVVATTTATVDAVITAVYQGGTTATADAFNVTTEALGAGDVVITPVTLDLPDIPVDGRLQLKATGTFSNGDTQDLTEIAPGAPLWGSSNVAVSVTSLGLILGTAVNAGVTIDYTPANSTGAADTVVVVVVDADDITVAPLAVSLPSYDGTPVDTWSVDLEATAIVGGIGYDVTSTGSVWTRSGTDLSINAGTGVVRVVAGALDGDFSNISVAASAGTGASATIASVVTISDAASIAITLAPVVP